MSRDWLKTLVEKEIKSIKERMEFFQEILKSKNRDTELKRIRDYRIFLNCTKSAFNNDISTGNEARITYIEAQTLVNIYEEFKQSKLNVFPVTLFRHGLLQEDVIIKALKK